MRFALWNFLNWIIKLNIFLINIPVVSIHCLNTNSFSYNQTLFAMHLLICCIVCERCAMGLTTYRDVCRSVSLKAQENSYFKTLLSLYITHWRYTSKHTRRYTGTIYQNDIHILKLYKKMISKSQLKNDPVDKKKHLKVWPGIYFF